MKKIERIRITMCLNALKVYYDEEFCTNIEQRAWEWQYAIYDQLPRDLKTLIEKIEDLL